jgi:hypothetical protein
VDIPYRKVAHVLDEVFGLRVAPGALARAEQRSAAKAEPAYQLLFSTLRQEPLVNGDETGWKVARPLLAVGVHQCRADRFTIGRRARTRWPSGFLGRTSPGC